MSQSLPEPSAGNHRDVMPESGDPMPAFGAAAAEQQQLANHVAALLQRGKNGAHWFYWIAGLSLVTSLIILGGGDGHFVIGLGITLVASSLAAGIAQQAPEAALTLQIVAGAFSVFVSGIVVLFGWMSAKRYTAVMATGMVLYGLDGMLYLLVQDWMSIGFHVFALYCMWTGLSAFRELHALERTLAMPRETADPLATAG